MVAPESGLGPAIELVFCLAQVGQLQFQEEFAADPTQPRVEFRRSAVRLNDERVNLAGSVAVSFVEHPGFLLGILVLGIGITPDADQGGVEYEVILGKQWKDGGDAAGQ